MIGLIVKRVVLRGNEGQTKAEVLFDSGARCSVIRKDVARKVATLIRLPTSVDFRLADGKTRLSTNLVVDIVLRINGRTILDQFPVLEKLSREVIIGANTLQSWEIKLDPKNESVQVGVDSHHLELI